jgi:multisubunit Na+/H+ antiporter MnhC subunit
MESLDKRFRRFKAIFDKSAWLLILPAVFMIFMLDSGLGRTLVTWSAFGIAISGLSVIISRIIFPHFDLSDLYERAAKQDSLPSALMASAIVIFVGNLILALVIWAKA